MARTRRRMMRRRRPKADWVYRHGVWVPGDDPDILTSGWYIGDIAQATYSPIPDVVQSSAAAARGYILYDSQNRLNAVASTFSTAAGARGVGLLSRAARAEGRGALCLRVQGQILMRPDTWSLGNQFYIGLRIGVFEQDPEMGNLLVSADYNMMDTGQLGPVAAGVWANDAQFVWEKRFWLSYNTDRAEPAINQYIDVKFRRRLKPNQCLGLYVENSESSVSVVIQRWLRTLVVDEG